MVVVDMVAQGPNDPMCCPTMPTTTAYGLYGSELVSVLQVAATIDGSPVTDQVLASIIQPTAYDNTMPPGDQGQPKHAVWSLDSSDPDTVMSDYGAYVAVYSVAAYEKMWNDAGDNYVSDTIAQLEKLLTDKPANPEAPLPILPEPPGTNDIAAQVAYLDLSDGGSGIRWVGRIGQSVNPVMPERLTYYFQGLTADGERLIVAQVPITIPVVAGVYTDSVSAEQMASIESDYTAYLAGVTEALNAEPAGAFTPSLEALDQVLQSVTITTTVNDMLPDALANIEYSSELAGGPVLLTGGQYVDTENRIVVTFIPSPIAYGALDGVPSAAVLTGENGGGSGIFTNLNVVQPQEGLPVAVASTMLGDRVYVNTLDITDNQIVVAMITQGPEDPMCCPTLPVTQTYTLADGALSLVNEEQGEPIAAAPAEDVAATDAMTETAAATDSAGETTGGTGDLAGTAWSWTNTQMNDGEVVAPAQADQFQVVFNADGTVAATTDCNTFRGRYEVTDNQITIELPISTRMACPEGSQQDAYIERLTSVQSYLMDGSDLILELPFDSGGMRFAPASAGNAEADGTAPVAGDTAEAAALAGTAWNWTGTQMNDDTVITPTVADAFQLTFGDDGTVATTTDCNTFSGSFTEGESGALTIALPISTLKACPEDAQEQKYIQDLTSIQSYLTQDGNLYLQLPVDSGTMSFAPVP
jgi:heat shock protein HslJ